MIVRKRFNRGGVGLVRVAVGLEKNDDLLTNSPIPSKNGRGRLEDGEVGNAISVHGRFIKRIGRKKEKLLVAVAGAAAGISSTFVCHPLEVLKAYAVWTLVLFCEKINKIYKDGGIGGFYAGLSPTLIGMLPYSKCYYFMYETMKKSYCKSKNKKSWLELMQVSNLA
ncbi:hypothetical protein QYF36_026525 [Acer negundo]|nr:hypothetical protein QYF36_026525 [Acer negundo]